MYLGYNSNENCTRNLRWIWTISKRTRRKTVQSNNECHCLLNWKLNLNF